MREAPMTQDIRHFAEELEEVKRRLLVMAGLAEERVRIAMRALVERDRARLAEVISGDQSINSLHLEIDDRCFKLLALHQPMAVDLRMIVGALKINTDLERVGDLAVNIGEAAERYVNHPPVKPLIDLPRMSNMAQRMLHASLAAFVSRDVGAARRDRAGRHAGRVEGSDFPGVADLHAWHVQTIEPGIELILIARHLERIGDHATNIAEDVIFIVEARDVRHHAFGPTI
jgi:phosphate transport system protein